MSVPYQQCTSETILLVTLFCTPNELPEVIADYLTDNPNHELRSLHWGFDDPECDGGSGHFYTAFFSVESMSSEQEAAEKRLLDDLAANKITVREFTAAMVAVLKVRPYPVTVEAP